MNVFDIIAISVLAIFGLIIITGIVLWLIAVLFGYDKDDDFYNN